VPFDTKVLGKISFETLQAKKGLGLHLVLVRKGSILCLIDPKRFAWESLLNYVNIRKYDKDYSSEDICFPHVKGFCEEGSLNRKIDSPRMKYPGVYVDSSWEKCL
jgi:hypothetical protein